MSVGRHAPFFLPYAGNVPYFMDVASQGLDAGAPKDHVFLLEFGPNGDRDVEMVLRQLAATLQGTAVIDLEMLADGRLVRTERVYIQPSEPRLVKPVVFQPSIEPTYQYSAADLALPVAEGGVGVANGGAVTTWRDRKGSGLDLVSATTEHTLVHADPGANNQPYVDFPGTQEAGVFNKDSGGAFAANNRHVVFVVAKLSSAAQMTLINWSPLPTGDIDNYDAHFGHNGAGTFHEFIHKAVTQKVVTGTTDPLTGFHVFAYRVGHQSQGLEVFLDSEVAEANDATIATAGTRTFLVGGRWTNAAIAGGGVIPLTGRIYDVLIYDERDTPARPLNNTEMKAVFDDARLQWGQLATGQGTVIPGAWWLDTSQSPDQLKKGVIDSQGARWKRIPDRSRRDGINRDLELPFAARGRSASLRVRTVSLIGEFSVGSWALGVRPPSKRRG